MKQENWKINLFYGTPYAKADEMRFQARYNALQWLRLTGDFRERFPEKADAINHSNDIKLRISMTSLRKLNCIKIITNK